MVQCPNCKEQLLKAYPQGKAKLRASIVIFKGAKSFGICKSCGSEVELPVVLTIDIPCVGKLYIEK